MPLLRQLRRQQLPSLQNMPAFMRPDWGPHNFGVTPLSFRTRQSNPIHLCSRSDHMMKSFQRIPPLHALQTSHAPISLPGRKSVAPSPQSRASKTTSPRRPGGWSHGQTRPPHPRLQAVLSCAQLDFISIKRPTMHIPRIRPAADQSPIQCQ